MELLKLTWWMEEPIDYEYKQYILLDYLQKVERHFINKDFSPYLLHTEKLYEEMALSLELIDNFEELITDDVIVFTQNGVKIEKSEIPTIKELDEMKNILKFSVPLLKQKVEIGKELWKQTPSILW